MSLVLSVFLPETGTVFIGETDLGNRALLLAPMEDVSDPPFRQLCRQHGADAVVTEFISSEGLSRDAEKSIRKLYFDKSERPVGIQIFGGNLDRMLMALEYCIRADPDFIDINYGCPVRKVVKKEAGAAILRDIPKMVGFTRAMVKASPIPVTVKTRLGWDQDSIRIIEVSERMQDVGIAAITIHGRTRCQMYKGKADWTQIAEVKNNPRLHIPVIGNGDIDNPVKAAAAFEKYNVDGIMIGRAAIGNPWIFEQIKTYMVTGKTGPKPGYGQVVDTALTHLSTSVKWKGDRRGIHEMRKHYGAYFKGWPHFKPFRNLLYEADTESEIHEIMVQIRREYGKQAHET